jgi:hypothetical protein
MARAPTSFRFPNTPIALANSKEQSECLARPVLADRCRAIDVSGELELLTHDVTNQMLLSPWHSYGRFLPKSPESLTAGAALHGMAHTVVALTALYRP